MRLCPALFISAASSHSGKTTVTAALAWYHRRLGRRVRVFKAGPDFIDPMILSAASGAPVYQLDLFMGGEDDCRSRLYEAAGEADLILIEGVMGLFDGSPSSADLCQRLAVPVLAVINCQGMAQTFNAVAHGLATYRPGLTLAGVLANGVASDRHMEMLAGGSLPENSVRCLGGFPRQESICLPSRHLGLVQAEEVGDLEARLNRAADAIGNCAVSELPFAVEFFPSKLPELPLLLAGLRIAIARDAAFSFLYQSNLDLLSAMGAVLEFFSPLHDKCLPEADSLYLPGGYPELHLQQLEGNTAMKAAIGAHVRAGKPLYAECGGMLYLLDGLIDQEGGEGRMCGILPGHAQLRKRLSGLGYQSLQLPGGILRGHTFHYSQMDSPLPPFAQAISEVEGGAGEPVYVAGRLFASYVHFYFPANPLAAASLFRP